MINLWKETIEVLNRYGKNEADIIWVGGTDFRITLENFKTVADKEYDNGFGAPEVATDLIVVGKDFWLERHEYDGSEWWEYKSHPQMPMEIKQVSKVFGGMWNTLAEINDKKIWEY